jgi:hypothetical protein
MCSRLTFLAKTSDTRFFALCSCGCLHLVWDNATIRLHQGDLENVVRALRSPPKGCSGKLLVRAAEGTVYVWFLSAGLRFSVAEFERFREMLERAHQRLFHRPDHPHVSAADHRPLN